MKAAKAVNPLKLAVTAALRPVNPKAAFKTAWSDVVSANKAAEGKMKSAFHAVLFYLPKDADFTGSTAGSLKAMKSQVLTVAKAAAICGPNVVHHALRVLVNVPGRYRPNVTKTMHDIRRAGKGKTEGEYFTYLDNAVRDRIAEDKAAKIAATAKAATAKAATTTGEKAAAAKSDAADAASTSDKVKSLAGFVTMIGNAVSYGRDLPTTESKAFAAKTVSALAALMVALQGEMKAG